MNAEQLTKNQLRGPSMTLLSNYDRAACR